MQVEGLFFPGSHAGLSTKPKRPSIPCMRGRRLHFTHAALAFMPTHSCLEGAAQVAYSNRLKRVALMVSKLDHCLYDLLIRRDSHELNCEIPVVISNHPGAAGILREGVEI